MLAEKKQGSLTKNLKKEIERNPQAITSKTDRPKMSTSKQQKDEINTIYRIRRKRVRHTYTKGMC